MRGIDGKSRAGYGILSAFDEERTFFQSAVEAQGAGRRALANDRELCADGAEPVVYRGDMRQAAGVGGGSVGSGALDRVAEPKVGDVPREGYFEHQNDIRIMKERYYFTELAGALERAISCDVGIEGLHTLLFGFIRKGGIHRETLRTRHKRDGEPWLTYYEACAFSEYAGYDLTQN